MDSIFMALEETAYLRGRTHEKEDLFVFRCLHDLVADCVRR